ncbi:YoaK family protein [Streptomyces sp. 769]|uniref:YoaK family protein n=1 Tax=Streptomyces sp. 769 TaxID=1262452 RepID=UPI00057DEA6A|nr:YoaK family protein [Streptomyces sp. 769]
MEPPSGAALTVVMVCLTVVTGVLDAASFLTLGHVFTATQTGNLLFLGFGISGQGGLPVAATVVSLGAFLAGAVTGARLESALATRRRPWFPMALLVEAALLAGAAVACWGSGPVRGLTAGQRYAAIALMALAMGMRNVTAMRVAAPDLTTTVETRAMTALVSGSALGGDRLLGYGSHAVPRRLSSVGAMLLGGLLGAWLIGLGTRTPLVVLLAAVTVAATALLVPGLAHGRNADG